MCSQISSARQKQRIRLPKNISYQSTSVTRMLILLLVVCALARLIFDRTFDWRRVALRPKRPMDTIILDPGVKENLLSDAREFTQSRKWYSDRGQDCAL